MGKYLPGYSYGMSGGPISISEQNYRMVRGSAPETKQPLITALCINCREATQIDGKPADNYYYRCVCKVCEGCGKVNSFNCYVCVSVSAWWDEWDYLWFQLVAEIHSKSGCPSLEGQCTKEECPVCGDDDDLELP